MHNTRTTNQRHSMNIVVKPERPRDIVCLASVLGCEHFFVRKQFPRKKMLKPGTMNVPFPHPAKKRRWILDSHCMPIITFTFCIFLWPSLEHQTFGCLAMPRKWLKDAELSDVDLIRQPFEKILAEGPFLIRAFLDNMSMKKQVDVTWFSKGLKQRIPRCSM